jgi:hypothetical protein
VYLPPLGPSSQRFRHSSLYVLVDPSNQYIQPGSVQYASPLPLLGPPDHVVIDTKFPRIFILLQQVLWDLRASFVRPEKPQVTRHLWLVLARNSLPDRGSPNKNQPQEYPASVGDSSISNSLFSSVSLHHCHTIVVPASLQSSLVNTCNRLLPHGWRDKVGHGSS